ncbi:MAG: TraE/TraK family type IV conjugative transfer system protein [Rhodospirillales bacterium]|nr:TraE/TraK family type IV conjugative transfer system protein [Rhodospirillales bacterium]
MRRETMETGLRRARDARVALAALVVLSMAANLVLALGLAGREAVTVLVPAVTGPAWEVGAGRAGQRYLEDMARTAAVTLLSLTPENAGHVREAAARLSHPSARGAISAWVAAEARRMAGRDLAAAFYPERIEADTAALAVDVEGELATWIGREESAREDKRYRLTFRLDAGRLGLVRFEEMEP